MKEKEFCTLLDIIGRHDKTKQLIPLLTKLCLTSLFASLVIKRTFVAPVGAALKKLETLGDAAAKVQIRRQLLRGVKGPNDIKTGDILISSLNDQYEVIKAGKEITLSAKGQKVDMKFLDENINASIYIAEELLPENMTDMMKTKLSKSVKSAKSKTKSVKSAKSAKSKTKSSHKGGNALHDHLNHLGVPNVHSQYGGYDDVYSTSSESDSDDENYQSGGSGFFSSAAEQIINSILNDPVLGMRHGIFNQYENAFPLSMYPMQHEYNFANRLYAALLVYLTEEMPNFINDYYPFLSSDSLSSLEILLQRWQSPMEINPNNMLLSNSMLQGFMGSPYWLNNDVGLLQSGREILTGFCNSFGQVGNCAYNSPSYWSQLAGQNVNSLMDLFNDRNQLPFRQGIVGVYQRLQGEPNRFDPGTEAIYRRVWGNQFGTALLRNDLMRYVSGIMNSLPFNQYNQGMAAMFGIPMDNTLSMLLQYDSPGNSWNISGDILRGFVNTPGYAFMHNFPTDVPGNLLGQHALTAFLGMPNFSELSDGPYGLGITTASHLGDYPMGQNLYIVPNANPNVKYEHTSYSVGGKHVDPKDI